MDNAINFLSGAISTVLVLGFLLLIGLPILWHTMRLILTLLPRRKKK